MNVRGGGNELGEHSGIAFSHTLKLSVEQLLETRPQHNRNPIEETVQDRNTSPLHDSSEVLCDSDHEQDGQGVVAIHQIRLEFRGKELKRRIEHDSEDLRHGSARLFLMFLRGIVGRRVEGRGVFWQDASVCEEVQQEQKLGRDGIDQVFERRSEDLLERKGLFLR